MHKHKGTDAYNCACGRKNTLVNVTVGLEQIKKAVHATNIVIMTLFVA